MSRARIIAGLAAFVGLTAFVGVLNLIAIAGPHRVALAPAASADRQCAPGHFCLHFLHVTLSIPDGYAHSLAPGAEMFGDLNPGSGWFLFWMPDGAPAANVREDGFYMFPDAFKGPVKPDARTLVEAEVEDWRPEKKQVGPDEQLWNRVDDDLYAYAHRADAARYFGHPDPVQVRELTQGTTTTIVDVSSMIGGGGFQWKFGRVGCDGQTCLAHFFYACAIPVPYPLYQVCDGNYAIRSLGIFGYVRFIQISDQTTLAMTEKIVSFLNAWSSQPRKAG